jgi:hypothetical protein
MIFSLFVLFFSACIDHTYDLDDENVDKNVVFSPDGINLPIGSIEEISVANELKKMYDNDNSQIKVDTDGSLFIEYAGEFPIEFPEFEIPLFSSFHPDPVALNIPGIQTGIPIPQGTLTLVNASAPYDMTTPFFKNGQEGLELTAEQFNFNTCSVDLTFNISGITFGAGSDANLILTLDYPTNFILKNGGKIIKKTISLTELTNGVYTLKGLADVDAYNYLVTDKDLSYQIDLEVKSPLSVTISGTPTFDMTLSVDNGGVQVKSLKCQVTGTESKADEINIEEFTRAFSGNTFEFENPSLEFALETNLASNFDLDANLFSEVGSAATSLQYQKPTQAYPTTITTSYLLSPVNPDNAANWKRFDLNKVFGIVPNYLNYEVKAHFEDKVLLYPNGLVLIPKYRVKLPFKFTHVDVNISDTVVDLFTEDVYEQLFEYAEGGIKIQADSVEVAIGKDMEIAISAKILDENYNDIGIPVQSVQLTNGTNTDFSIEIDREHKAKMIDARHLEFTFKLKGNGTISTSDFIHIQKIRIISDDGIHFTF